MAKEVVRVAKLEFNAGQAKPGPELAGLGIVMPEFTKQFNDQTKDRGSEPVPVEITISKTTIVATISVDQLREIAEYKLVDLNTDNVESAMKIIAGTAKNMGIAIEGWDDIAKLKEEAKAAKIAEQKAHAAEIKLAEDVKHAAEQKEFVEAEVINKKPANEEGEE